MTISKTYNEGTEIIDLQEDIYNFLKEEEKDNISSIQSGDDDRLKINIKKLKEYSEDLYDNLINSPKEFLYNAEVLLKEDFGKEASIRLENPENVKKITELRKSDVGKLISVEAIISKSSSITPILTTGVFKCRNCGTTTEVPQIGEEILYPLECPNEDCGRRQNINFLLEKEKSDFIDYQKLHIQELPENVEADNQPESIEVNIWGDMTGVARAGDKVEVTGIIDIVPDKTNKGSITSSIMDIDIRGVTLNKKNKDIYELEITEEDEKRIKELSNKDNIHQLLKDSLAPSIKGLDHEKTAAVLQMFSGVTKNEDNEKKSRIRGDIHVLLVGDPGTGKSQILKRVSKIVSGGRFTSGKGASSAGLTAAAINNGDNGWRLEAGILPLADQSIAAIDEIDKMSSSDRNSMHEALEQQTISIDKAGMNTTLNSRCGVIAAANPKLGRWISEQTTQEQIDLEPALISRFDLIFTVIDEPDTQDDEKIASHIIKNNKEGELEAKNEEEKIQEDSLLSDELIRKYLAYSQKNCFPELTPEAEEEIKDFYVKTRQKGDNNNVPITARKLEALIRLAEASARVRLSEKIEKKDIEMMASIIMKSLNDVGIDPETGELDASLISSGITSSDRQRYNKLDKFLKENTDKNNLVKLETINEEVEGLNSHEIKEELSKLSRNGSVFTKNKNTKKPTKYRWIN